MSDESLVADHLPQDGPSLQALQDQIKTSHIPSSGDGITNAWRTYYVCEVFDCQDINLNQTFPFQSLMRSKDLDKVRASVHLAKLQFQFNESCRYHGYVDDDGADYIACYLHHMIRLMVHHLSFLERDKPTPPIGFH